MGKDKQLLRPDIAKQQPIIETNQAVTWLYFVKNLIKLVRILLTNFNRVELIENPASNRFKLQVPRTSQKTVGKLLSILEKSKSFICIEEY